jgi:hypothetical protein
MAEAVYVLCAVTSIVCAVLLLRGHQRSKTPLLFWSALCFAGLALNNLMLLTDLVLVPSVDLTLWRSMVAVIAVGVLLGGLIWESK